MFLNKDLIYPELHFKTSRSGGAGGQHVNKVESKVSLFWNVWDSAFFTQPQKDVILRKLSNRITNEGVLQLDASADRSQLKNKQIVVGRFFNLLEQALEPEKLRKATKVPRSVILRRLDRKKKQSHKKQSRRNRFDIE
ncbi:alternative ribosome rescue aminoacyl-tRNA hydrolase ArfB [Sphingobacterium sp. JB170]|uniref:alternative ribosome rescue aminoacyl-tRNA hydrolase ArfB n=1 Tax=Sphingobacterium sp. JB170 TaxID=1434842 RepID=UPI00097EACB4|nr:alternative ribosome rescue aminoacyl-tRNA hydrolase ArfB [Sphingobacterium sp. JB170]SJN32173.1 Hypothetical protein YaeJ with similarity to translation release factor [Sphingobacterium sp. JB170]